MTLGARYWGVVTMGGGGELHRLARDIIRDNRLFDPPDFDGRMPRVSKWER